MGESALLIFVKTPVLGNVKTRLAKDIGDENALNVYLRLLEHTKGVASKVQADVYVFYHGEVATNDLWDGFKKEQQIDADLGGKMFDAFQRVKAKGYEKMVIIGSDCAEISEAIIQQGFDELNGHDVVFGPALDGGYYLLGMKEVHPCLFEGKPWSTATLLQETVEDCKQHSLTHALLEELSDIDYLSDLKTVFSKLGWSYKAYLPS